MVRTQIYIPEELYNQAKLMASFDGVSISEYIREGLLLKMQSMNKKTKNRKQSPLSKMVGKYSLGNDIVTNVAKEHNDIYD